MSYCQRQQFSRFARTQGFKGGDNWTWKGNTSIQVNNFVNNLFLSLFSCLVLFFALNRGLH